MSVELINKDTVVEYLISKKVIQKEDNPQVEVLTGGVSNVVLAITTTTQKLVLKQALAELAVSEKWEADQRRAIVEANACFKTNFCVVVVIANTTLETPPVKTSTWGLSSF